MKKSKCHDFLEMQPKGLEGHGHSLDPQNFSSLLFSSRVAGDHTLLLQDPCASTYGFHWTINSMVIKEMYLEEFPSIWCFFLSMQFRKCTCLRWDVLASFAHLEPEAGGCVLLTPVLLTGTQEQMRSAVCPLLSRNAEILWMLRSPCMCDKLIQILTTWD